MRLLAALWAVGACEAETLPPDFGGEPLWTDLVFADATDLGETVGPLDPDEQRAGGPIRFNDVTSAAGLSEAIAGGNTHGVGVAFADLDGDDWADILVVSGRSNVTGDWFPSVMYRNRGDGTFEEWTSPSSLTTLLDGVDGYSVAAGDIDSDGDTDLYVGAQPTDLLLLNAGDGTFSDGTVAAGAGGPASDPSLVGDGKSKVVSIGDFDGDGALDLVSASSTLPAPGVYLLRNRGDGTFEDRTTQSGVRIHASGNPCAVMWSDYDTDADRDLWIWNDRGGHVLLRNDGGTFTDVADASGVGSALSGIRNPMGIDAGDIDLDGDLDYYVSNIGNNPLLRNNGDGTFSDITDRAGTGGQFGWGLALEDFDADGWLDIFVMQEDDLPHLVFHNLQTVPASFEELEVPHIPVVHSSLAHNVAAAFADYDHDGRVDAVVVTTDGSRITLYRNETDFGSNGYLQINVGQDPGGIGPGIGIGARVVISTDDTLRFRDVTGGSSRASQNEHGLRFGLGQYRGADWVGVLWPGGGQAVVTNVGAGQRISIP